MTESGRSSTSVTPNIPRMEFLKSLRIASFAALEAALRPMLPMKSNFDFGATRSP